MPAEAKASARHSVLCIFQSALKVPLAEHRGIAPCIPAWKAGVYLSTPMLEMKLESRKGIAPFFAVLQTAA